MIKKISVVGIMFLLLVSIASASVLDYYGKAIGIADVLPPIFYASPEQIEDYKLYRLKINELPSAPGEISFTDGSFIGFTTDALEITSFYQATYNFYVKAKVVLPPRNLSLEFWVRDTNGNLKQLICWTKVNIDSTDYKIYPAFCSVGPLSLSNTDSFYWKLYGLTTASVDYTIMVDGDTRIEVFPT